MIGRPFMFASTIAVLGEFMLSLSGVLTVPPIASASFLGSLNAAVVVDVLACEGLIFVELGLYGFVEAGPKKRSLTTNYKSFVVDRQI